VTSEDIARLGVGGLLGEIAARPQPRQSLPAAARPNPPIAALILAAGLSRRMHGSNKLVASMGGKPMVRLVGEAALASSAGPIVAVTGHQADDIRSALAGLNLRFAHNAGYAEGLASSLRTGLAALPADVDGALVLLGDMPGIDAAMIDRLIAAHFAAEGADIIVPTHGGQRGNPILWPARFFDELRALQGDVGGRQLLSLHADSIREVELGTAVGWDIDTPQELIAAGGARGG
jgi:molybdenum cofactor cytidylyltransferase